MFLLLKCAVTGQQVIVSVVLVPNLDKWGDLHQKGHVLFAKSNMWIINNFHHVLLFTPCLISQAPDLGLNTTHTKIHTCEEQLVWMLTVFKAHQYHIRFSFYKVFCERSTMHLSHWHDRESASLI